MNIETYGTGNRLAFAAEYSRNLQSKHIVLLPIPTTKDKIHVNGTNILLEETLCNVTRGSVVVGYSLPDEYVSSVKLRGGRTLDLLCDEDFLKENSYATAVGCVEYILTSSQSLPNDVTFGIVGYGRIGKELLRILLFLGGRVKIFTTKKEKLISLGSVGIECELAKDDGNFDFQGIEILINTAPCDMRNSFPSLSIPSGMRIIELASGNNFDGISGIERLPSLPEKAYPRSAGRAYCESIERFLSRNGEWGV